jgi:hypothetical protein
VCGYCGCQSMPSIRSLTSRSFRRRDIIGPEAPAPHAFRQRRASQGIGHANAHPAHAPSTSFHWFLFFPSSASVLATLHRDFRYLKYPKSKKNVNAARFAALTETGAEKPRFLRLSTALRHRQAPNAKKSRGASQPEGDSSSFPIIGRYVPSMQFI